MGILSTNLKLIKLQKPYKQAEIAEFVGVTVSTWSNYEIGKTEPTIDTLMKISKFFGITLDELLREGNLFEENENSKNSQNGNLKGNAKGNLTNKNVGLATPETWQRMPKVITVDSAGNDNIVHVSIRARAGYLNGYEDPEYIQTLPAYRIPGLSHGTYRMFEIFGTSMVPTFHESDVLICRYVESFHEIRDNRVYIVVTKRDGVVAKRVINRIARDGKLILNSDNQKHYGEFPPIVIDPEDVLEIWYGVVKMTRQIGEPGEVLNRLIDVESRLTMLEHAEKKRLGK